MATPAEPARAHGVDIEALRRHVGERHAGRPVECIETHVSWVLLCDDRAYKLKKPVHTGFLDFRDVASRRLACEEELRLDRRLAPDWTLDVLPVTGTPQAPALGGPGPAIDHVVCMRRFPAGAGLDERLAAGTLAVAHVEALARRVGAFHLAAPVAPASGPYGLPEAMVAATEALWQALAAARPRGLTPALHTWLATESARLAPTWRARRAAGFVREGHGDLHLANAFATDDGAVAAFDGIEFDPALRWIDTIADTAFMVMDLEAHGRADLAYRFLDGWLEVTGDHAGVRLLRHAMVARALVRARVALLPGAARPPGAPPDYLATARAVCRSPAPLLVLLHGAAGTGQSHVAAALRGPARAVRLRSDVERKRLFGLAPRQRPAPGDVDALYGVDATQRTYATLRERAADLLAAGRVVLVDATFLRRAERAAFAELARSLHLRAVVLACRVDAALAEARLAARAARDDDASDADAAVREAQCATRQPIADDEGLPVLDVDTTGAVDAGALWARCRRTACLPAVNAGVVAQAKNGTSSAQGDPR